MNDRSRLAGWLATGFVFLLILLAIQPLLRGHTPWPGDGLLHFYRLAQLELAVRQGLLFPRWLPDLGYGYGFPLFNYYAPLSYYISLLPRLFGVSLATSLSFSFAIALLVLGLAIFLWARSVWQSLLAGITALLATIYAPYILYNTYHRSALAELWGLAFFVLVLWAMNRLLSPQRPVSALIIATLSYAALILSHNILALIGTPVILAYVLFLILLRRADDRKQTSSQNKIRARWIAVFAFILLALGLSAFFWLPAFFERDLVQIENLIESSNFIYSNNFLDTAELLAWPSPADPSQVNPPIPRSLAWPAILLALCAWLPGQSLSTEKQAHRLGLSLITLAFIAMTLPISRLVWDTLPLLSFVQFPWRFLGLASIGLGMLAGLGADQLWVIFAKIGTVDSGRSERIKGNWTIVLRPLFIVLLIFSAILLYALPFLFPAAGPPLPESISPADTIKFESETGWLGTTAAADYLPRTVLELPPPDSLLARYEAAGTKGQISRLNEDQLPREFIFSEIVMGPLETHLNYRSEEPVTVQFDLFAFPGWQAWLDDQPAELTITEPFGLLSGTLPAGDHEFELRFEDTFLRQFAKIISLLSLVIVVIVIGYSILSSFRQSRQAEQRSLKFPIILSALIVVLLISLVKTVYLDQSDTLFRRQKFDGRQITGRKATDQINFGDELMLLAHEMPADPLPTDQPLEVVLFWRALTPVEKEYSVGLHLVNEDGQRYGQHDSYHPAGLPVTRWQADQYGRDSHRLEVWPGTPPGIYQLKVFVYETATNQRLELLNEAGLPVDVEYNLGEIVIGPPIRFPDPADVVVEMRETDLGPSPELAEGVQLLGFNVPSGEVEVGHLFPISLFWHTPTTPNEDYDAELTVACEGQGIIAKTKFPSGSTPGEEWQPGQIQRADERLWLSPLTEEGQPVGSDECTAVLSLVSISGEEIKTVALSSLNLTVPTRTFDSPSPEFLASDTLDKLTTLIGYDLDQTVKLPGDNLEVNLHWQALGTSEIAYTVFVQLVGENGRIYAQQDQSPAAGKRPTTGWLPGEYIVDEYQLTIDPEAQPGIYHLLVGMYDSRTGERLSTSEPGQDAIVLSEPIRISNDN